MVELVEVLFSLTLISPQFNGNEGHWERMRMRKEVFEFGAEKRTYERVI